MKDYAVRMDQNDCEPPGPFVVGRGVRMNGQVLDQTDGATEAPLDMSGSRWKVYVRAYVARSSTALLVDQELTKSTAGAATGFFDHYYSCGATAYAAALCWEWVLVDTENADTTTKSGKREYVLLEWKAPILGAPRTGP